MHISLIINYEKTLSIFSSIKQFFAGKLLLLKITQQKEHNFKDNFLIVYPPIFIIISSSIELYWNILLIKI